MSDQNPEIVFEEDEDNEEGTPEIMIVSEEEAAAQAAEEEQGTEKPEDPERVTLSREDFQALVSKRDDPGMKDVLAGLTDVIRNNRTPVNGADESSASAWQRISNDLLDSDKAEGALTEAISRVTGPVINQTYQQLRDARRELLEIHPDKGPLYRRFKNEIDRKFNSLDTNQQHNPNVYNYVYEEVIREHAPELEEERINARAKDIAKQTLAELGYEMPEDGTPVRTVQGPSRRRATMPAPSALGGMGGGRSQPTRVTLNATERAEYDRMFKRGMSREAILMAMGKIK